MKEYLKWLEKELAILITKLGFLIETNEVHGLDDIFTSIYRTHELVEEELQRIHKREVLKGILGELYDK